MTKRSGPVNGPLRRTVLKATASTAGALAISTNGGAHVAQGDDDEVSNEKGDNFRIPHLDLDTLEAERGDELLQAEPLYHRRPQSTTYVGETGGRSSIFVGVSLLNDAVQPSEEEDDDRLPDVVVYLCDGEVGVTGRRVTVNWLAGTFDQGGMKLTKDEVPEDVQEGGDGDVREIADDVEVTLALVDGTFIGVMIGVDEEPIPFYATEATDDAGVFAAEPPEGGDMVLRWIVLPDGRQRGARCCFSCWVFCREQ